MPLGGHSLSFPFNFLILKKKKKKMRERPIEST